ncbi:MAG: pyrroloquinoline quinone biosynthesis peptide chaperone PqqD [Gaiellaceae bacterium]
MTSAEPIQQLPRRLERIVFEQAGEDQVLLDPDSGKYFLLNEVGARVWALCDGKRSVTDIVAVLASEYDASEDTLARDVQELLDELADDRLIVGVEGGRRSDPR